MTLDIDSLLIIDWIITKRNIHDSRISHDMAYYVSNFSYMHADSVCDTSDTYDYVFENTHALPVIDTNMRRGIVPERLSVNRRIGIDLRREYASLNSLWWKIERTFSIMQEIMKVENIWYNEEHVL